MHKYLTLKIASIKQETADTKTFILMESETERINYKPGQFLTLLFPGKFNEERRSYSISSTPLLNEPLSITVKRIDNGIYSRFLFDNTREGSLIYTIGAAGFFTLPDDVDHYDAVMFFAAGSGITPVFPLIKTLLYSKAEARIFLIYSNHSRASAIFYDELMTLLHQFPDRFEVDFLFSDAKNLLRARLNKVLVSEYLSQMAYQKEKVLVFMCGPHGFMQMLEIALLTEGIPVENIRKEIFDTKKPVIRETPADTDPHRVKIRFDGDEFSFVTQYPETILQTAKREGIELPYSCEAGKCGTCAATCLSGKVWMYYNEVLLDKELMSGRVLTCTGYPVGGDVTLVVGE